MIEVVAVRVGDRYPVEYVDRLAAMIERHTTRPFGFSVITTSPYPGWWAKVDLFKPRDARTLYFDLDTVIVGNIDPLFDYDGPFAILADFWGHTYNSSVMSIAPGVGSHVWSRFVPSLMARYHGDQDWITEQMPGADLWQARTPGLIGSYKADNLIHGPKDFSVVCFHGHPKMHELEPEHWARVAWEAL